MGKATEVLMPDDGLEEGGLKIALLYPGEKLSLLPEYRTAVQSVDPGRLSEQQQCLTRLAIITGEPGFVEIESLQTCTKLRLPLVDVPLLISSLRNLDRSS